MAGVFDALTEEAREKLEKKKLPRSPKPMLATLTGRRFSDPGWIFERKLDGVRCLAVAADGDPKLLSRNGKKLNDTYPEIEEALSKQKEKSFILDGEVVAFSGRVTSFERLQNRMQIKDRDRARQSSVAVYYYVFDLLYLRGYDTTGVELRDRKELLRRSFEFSDPVRFTQHRNEKGEAFYREACKKGWEGLIAKRADSQYVHGRSKSWLKFKCVNRQELVIGGFTEPDGTRIGFGALVVGYYDADALVYAGKVGTGYDDATLERLGKRLKSMERKTSPFDASDDLPRKNVHWVSPKLVGEFGFTEWTRDGKLRHPRFLGLRRDKDPRDVVRERPSG